MDNNIILSICISAYNRKDLVCKNVRKILRYRGDDIEVIVSDNASEDGTVEALKEIEDNRLKIYRNEINVGLGGNTLRLLTYAIGKYVMTINDRDWIEPSDIRTFVKTYRNRECDFILAAPNCSKNDFQKYEKSVDGRTFCLCRFCHPGWWIVRGTVYDELVAKAKKVEIGAYTGEWLNDIFYFRMALCLYAEKWEHFKTIVRQPKPEKLSRIVQLRGKSDAARLFFTPEGILMLFGGYIDNPYIRVGDVKRYVIGVYRDSAYCSLLQFYRKRIDPYTLARYHYEPEPSVCWIKHAIKFYKDAILILKEKGLCTYRLEIIFALITIKEYIRLCAERVTLLKNGFFFKL